MRFLFVDKILDLVPGQYIKAVKNINPQEEIFKDHFPGFPVIPGVLLTETMAQAAGKCLDAEKKSRGKAMLAQIRSANFRDWVKPGQDLFIYATVKVNRESFATADCYIEVNEKKVCNAELFFSFLPLGKFEAGYADEVLKFYLSSGT